MVDFRALQKAANGQAPSHQVDPDLEGLFDLDLLQKHREKTVSSNIPITEVRKNLTEMVEKIIRRPDQQEYHKNMGVERGLPAKTFFNCKSFFVPPATRDSTYLFDIFEGLHRYPEYGLVSEHGLPIYEGRYIYPVLGFNQEVLGLIGYDKGPGREFMALNPGYKHYKYLLSKTVGFGKSNMFYGMDTMRSIYKKGYVFVIEGIVDQLFLRTIGEPSLAMNGNSLSDFLLSVLLRFGKNVILVPDNNETGAKAISYWQSLLPEASTLYITSPEDDLDKWRLNHDYAEFKAVLDDIKFNLSIGNKKDYFLH